MPRAVLEGTVGSAGPAVPPTQSTRCGGRRRRQPWRDRRWPRPRPAAADQLQSAQAQAAQIAAQIQAQGARLATPFRAVRPGPDPRPAARAAGDPDPGADRPDQDTGGLGSRRPAPIGHRELHVGELERRPRAAVRAGWRAGRSGPGIPTGGERERVRGDRPPEPVRERPERAAERARRRRSPRLEPPSPPPRARSRVRSPSSPTSRPRFRSSRVTSPRSSPNAKPPRPRRRPRPSRPAWPPSQRLE